MIDMRMPEHGRIRLGIETTFASGKKGPKSIETFRFTSSDESAIRALAQKYGGTVRPWANDKATIQSPQWEVVTEAKEMQVFLPPDAISISFEIWGGGGIERRCDGHTCELYSGDDTKERPCICLAEGERECKPYTRMKVVIPDIPFGGIWRLESKGENAAAELPAMEAALRMLQNAEGLLPAKISLEVRTTRKGGKKKIYVVPRLSMLVSAQELMSGTPNVALEAPAPLAIEAALVVDPRVAQSKPASLDMDDAAWEAALRKTSRAKGVDIEVMMDDLISGVARFVQLNSDGSARLGRGRT